MSLGPARPRMSSWRPQAATLDATSSARGAVVLGVAGVERRDIGRDGLRAPHLRPQGAMTSAAATALDGGAHALSRWSA